MIALDFPDYQYICIIAVCYELCQDNIASVLYVSNVKWKLIHQPIVFFTD